MYSLRDELFIPGSLCIAGARPFVNLMNILDERDGGDSELLVYAMTLINKVTPILNKGRAVM